jgi:N-acetyl sugar amidotransferase
MEFVVNTETFYGLPPKVEFCRNCVISNQRPNSTVEFGSTKADIKSTIAFMNGLCSACTFAFEKDTGIDWQEREQRLINFLATFKRTDGRYDVIVPGSGGKDSAYTAHVLKYKYGMNPLTVTWAPHTYTDIGWKNFSNWMHVGGLDNILYTPNGKLHRLLTRLAFLNLLHPFQPFIIGQRIIGPAMAARFGVKLVMYGENQAEYGNDIADNNRATMSPDFFSTGETLNMKFGGVTMREIIAQHGFNLGDFAPYIPPTRESLENAGIEVHYLGYYLKWDPQECYYYAVENTGFEANPERTEGTYSKYSSIDDRIDPFHYYTTLAKFGLGRASYDSAQEVRNGKITRDEAVSLVRKFDQEFPAKYFKDFLEYISVTESEFHATVDSYRSPHLWHKVGGAWQLKHEIS